MSQQREIELKLLLLPGALAKLERHAVWRRPRSSHAARLLDSRYFDTPAQRLAAHGITLRIRRSGVSCVQTVKRENRIAGGLIERAEWSSPYEGRFDFTAVTDRTVSKQLRRHADRLRPLFRTVIRRKTRLWHGPHGSTIAISLDRGHIACARRRLTVSELELELVRGPTAQLHALAERLVRELPLVPCAESKPRRGMRLLQRPESTTDMFKHFGDSTGLETFKLIACELVSQWQDALPSFDPLQAESVHALRLLLRRSRTLLRVFAPVLPAKFHRRWTETLRGAARAFDAARDFDVLLTDVSRRDSRVPLDAARLRVIRKLHDRASNAHRKAARTHDRTALALLSLRLAEDVRRLRNEPAIHPESAKDLARRRLRSLDARTRRRFKAVDVRDRRTLHRLRIALKQARDARLELLPWLSRKELSPIEPLRRATMALGELQDLDRARTLLTQLLNDEPQLAAAITTLVTDIETRHRKTMPEAVRRARRALRRC